MTVTPHRITQTYNMVSSAYRCIRRPSHQDHNLASSQVNPSSTFCSTTGQNPSYTANVLEKEFDQDKDMKTDQVNKAKCET